MSPETLRVAKSEDPLAVEAIAQVRRWVELAAREKSDGSGRRLAGLLGDPNGLAFAVGFIDGVIRPEDIRVAARNLSGLAPLVPKFLPWPLRLLLKLGSLLARWLPWPIIPIAKRVLRLFVSHLVVDASSSKLGRQLKRLKRGNARLNINLLGEAVLGEEEANRRLAKIAALLSRANVDYLSVKVSAVISPQAKWAFDETVTLITERLRPLYRIAKSGSPAKFINLDMEEYHDLHLTIEVFKRLLGEPEFLDLEAGIVLQAYLPDALGAMKDLQDWAKLRVDSGGAPIKVRVVKGANLPMERVDAELHGWPLATVPSKAHADANYLSVLDYALNAERSKNIRIGVAGHNLFSIAYALQLAKERGLEDAIDLEMLLGMAQAEARVVSADLPRLVLYTPVVHPKEFDVAIAYLIRRLEEGAAKENFLSNAFSLVEAEPFAVEQSRFLESLSLFERMRAAAAEFPESNRVQDRANEAGQASAEETFQNCPDTDPAVAANQLWAKEIIEQSAVSELGLVEARNATIETLDLLEDLLSRTHAAGQAWGKVEASARAEALHEAGHRLAANRGRLIEVAMSEAGKTFDQADTEISEAIDFAHYYAEQAKALASISGASPAPRALTLVTPPWNFPIAIPAGSALAALAAGSAVVLKPAGEASRCGALLWEVIHGSFPKDVLSLAQLSEEALGRELISHRLVDQVILTGGFETARLFKSFKPELRLLAETSGKNSMIISPHADLDVAVKDLVYSAFGHAGQKCSAASIAVLVGSVAKSQRFGRQLVDAVSSLKVALPSDPVAQVGPLIARPGEKLLAGLTQLEPGESWLLAPKALDSDGNLWSPGIRVGVRAGSRSHKTEYFGPVLAIMEAKNLDAALEIQNGVDYGLTAGIHSLDRAEVGYWLANVEAGNLYVNRGITGAIVQRQPFGGWKRSAIGPTAKAGGPNYLMCLTGFETAPISHSFSQQIALPTEVEELIRHAEASLPDSSVIESLRRAALSDQLAMAEHYSLAEDVSGLQVEQNIFRYRRADTKLRIGSGARGFEIWRPLLAASTLGQVEISLATEHSRLAPALKSSGLNFEFEDDMGWIQKLAPGGRWRLVGPKPESNTFRAAEANCELALFTLPPVESGRLELLPYFKEQSISITAHRFGNLLPKFSL